jgi:hypothetical protein
MHSLETNISMFTYSHGIPGGKNLWPSPFQVCTSRNILKDVQQGVDASSVKETDENARTRLMEAEEGESYTDTLTRHVINQDIDLDASFGFTGGTYAGPPYSPLSLATFTIRILMLQPGNFNDDIRGFLVAIPLHSKPPYMALSYVWGDAKDTVSIYFNGQEVFVTKNLASALRQLRDPTGVHKVWADALCINQTDAIEKSCQVAQMGKIYQNATEVIVWLGQDEEKSQDDWQGSAERTKKAFEFARSLANPSSANDAVLSSQVQNYPEEDSGLRAFINLLCRDWFSRCWVIQEVLLPDVNKVRAVCGSRGIPWIVLRAAAQNLQDLVQLSSPALTLAMKARPAHLLLLEAMRAVTVQANVSAQHPARKLCALILFIGGKFHATDRRDRLFALLSLIHGISDYPLFVPDYTKSVNDVFIDFAKFLGEEVRTGEFLVHAHARDIDALPSWVPTWSTELRFPSPLAAALRPNQPAPVVYSDIAFPDRNTLRVKGVMIGNIALTWFCALNWGDMNEEQLRFILQKWEEMILYIASGNREATRQMRKRTLLHAEVPTELDDLRKDMKSIMSDMHDTYDAFTRHGLQSESTSPSKWDNLSTSEKRRFMIEVASRISEDQPFITSEGNLAFTKTGRSTKLNDGVDVVCLIPGCSMPLMLRPEDDHFILLGPCYVDWHRSVEKRALAFLRKPIVDIDIR